MALWDKFAKAVSSIGEGGNSRAPTSHKEAQVPSTSPSYRHGSDENKTALVFSTPGSKEQVANAPLAGQSGKTVNRWLPRLNAGDPKTFPDTEKSAYRTVNVTEQVHFKKATDRTEGRASEYLAPDNLSRIGNALAGKTTAVAHGKPAQEAVRASGFAGKIIDAPHPSGQSLNTNKELRSSAPTRASRVEERDAKVVNSILKQSKKD